LCFSFDKKSAWATFWAILLQMNLVTLHSMTVTPVTAPLQSLEASLILVA
jgi:hypothetical protein